MVKLVHRISSFFLVVSMGLVLFSAHAQAAQKAILLDIQDTIGPATQDFIHQEFKQAQKQNVAMIILSMDTPGGLSQSMRGIIQDIISSPIPVITYVAPSGARAASAGTYILYASHITAMAPGTNLGAATPITLGDSSNGNKDKKIEHSAAEKKAINDATAYIRSLAQMRGRNAQWAEQAVQKAASLSADEALKMHVIDFIAQDVPSLLNQIDGHRVLVQGSEQTVHTKGLIVQRIVPNWRYKFLLIITNPNVAYILMLMGMYGLIFEFANPGFVLPGVIGGISLLLALYAFQLLPVNYVGFGLIIVGIACMVSEAFMPSFGTLGIGGVIAFAIGSLFLLDTSLPAFKIAASIIIAVTLITAAFFLLIVNMALRARWRPVITGREQLIGSVGIIEMSNDGLQHIRFRGEFWQVKSEKPLQAGQKVRVVSLDGLVLDVEPQE